MAATTMDPLETAISFLSERCDGARREDGAGFNKIDAAFGHSLANQVGRWSERQRDAALTLVQRYRKQVFAGTGVDVLHLTDLVPSDSLAGTPEPPTLPALTPEQIIGPGGLVAGKMPGYEARASQLLMADAAMTAIRDDHHATIEAPTGVGKSLGYLSAIAASGQRAIVSTADKSLQDQVAGKDIPFLQSVLPNPFTAAKLKGRSNYLCLARLEDVADLNSWDVYGGKEGVAAFPRVQEWAKTTDTGDLEELPFSVPPDLQRQLTVTSEECLGQRCPLYDECFVERAKARAKVADVVVVNHALLLRDASLRAMTQGHNHILPEASVCVIDEAHRLEEVAADSLGVEVTIWRWRRAKERFEQLTIYATEFDPDWAAQAARMVAPAHAIGDLLEQAIAGIEDRMLRQQIGTQRLQEEPLLAGAAHLLRSFSQQFSAAPPPWLTSIPNPRKALKRCGEWRALGRSITRLAEDLTAISAGDDANVLRYAELVGVAGRQHVKLLAKFIDVAPLLRRLLYTPTVQEDEETGETKIIGYASVIHTSATLTTGDGFTSWRRRIGLDNADELAVPSPFDYPRQGLLYLPQDGAAFDPSQDFKSGGSGPYFGRLCTEIESLVRASSGRAFLLFASGKMMRRVYDEIAHRLPYTTLVQGEMPRAELVRRFKESGHAVLFGLKSFWEGVDVVGEALSLVVIDKLPFGMPDDPLWSARCDAITRRGGSWFGELALPQATIALKQATGRLIRTRTDKGVVAVLDGRLSTKAYGQQIIKALPPFACTHSLPAVQAFFRTAA